MHKAVKWVRFIALPTLLILLFLVPMFDTLNVQLGDRKTCAFVYDQEYFTYEFRHSVNKGLIIETYSLNPDDSLHIKEALFENYGAGMLDQVPQGVVISEDGSYLKLTFEEQTMPSLQCIAGREAKQIIRYGDRELALFTYAGKPITIFKGKSSLFGVLAGYKLHQPVGSFIRD